MTDIHERNLAVRDTPEWTKLSFEGWLDRIEGPNKIAVQQFLDDDDHAERLRTAPGSRDAHHGWEGGYAEHIRQTMMIAASNYDLMEQTGLLDELSDEERFDLSDALTVMFLHDIEKPFVYAINADGGVEKVASITKSERKAFRQDVINRYGFAITPTMENALKFVEGVRDEDYVPGERADQPLAALCHAADNISARAYYAHRGYDAT